MLRSPNRIYVTEIMPEFFQGDLERQMTLPRHSTRSRRRDQSRDVQTATNGVRNASRRSKSQERSKSQQYHLSDDTQPIKSANNTLRRYKSYDFDINHAHITVPNTPKESRNQPVPRRHSPTRQSRRKYDLENGTLSRHATLQRKRSESPQRRKSVHENNTLRRRHTTEPYHFVNEIEIGNNHSSPVVPNGFAHAQTTEGGMKRSQSMMDPFMTMRSHAPPNHHGYVLPYPTILPETETAYRMWVSINNRGMSEIDISDRNLRELPMEIFKFIRVQVLRASRNILSHVPIYIGQLRKLRILDVHYNQITSIAETICNCQHLVELDLSYNKLRSLPTQLALLKCLRILKLGHNLFEHLPSDIGHLEDLKILDLQANKLTSIPFTFHNFKKLKSLNLAKNKIEMFPVQLCQLKTLECFNIKDNLLKSLPPDLDGLKSLKELNLQQNTFESFPIVIFTLKNLTVLNVANNRIKMLPSQVSKLTKLKYLHAENNRLVSLNCNFESLEYLNGANNLITNCAMISVRYLKHLNLNHNRLENLPLGVCNILNLEVLKLSNNKIQYLSKDIELLKQLKSLDISYNKLTQLPQAINELTRLEHLHITGNKMHNQVLIERKGVGTDMAQVFGPLETRARRKWRGLRLGSKKQESKSVQAEMGSIPVRHPFQTYNGATSDLEQTSEKDFSPDRESNHSDTESNRFTSSLTNLKRLLSFRNEIKQPEMEFKRHLSMPNQTPNRLLNNGIVKDGNWTLVRRQHSAHPRLQMDNPEQSSPTSDMSRKSIITDNRSGWFDSVSTDYTLLGMCNHLESLIHQQLLKPVISHRGNFKSIPGEDSQSIPTDTPFETFINGPPTPEGAFVRMKPDKFTVTPAGGLFLSSVDPNIKVFFPLNAVDSPMDIVMQIEKVDQEVLLKSKYTNKIVDNIISMGHIVHIWQSRDINFNEQVQLTIPAPSSPRRGKVHVLNYREDGSCVPCSTGFKSFNGYITLQTWHFSGRGAVLTKGKCKYKACKSVEQLLNLFNI